MATFAALLSTRAPHPAAKYASLALLMLALAGGCSSDPKSSSSGPGGDGDTGDGDTGDGDTGDGDTGDGDTGDGDGDGDGDTGDGDGDTPTFTYEDEGANGAFKDPSLPDDVREHFSGESSSSDAPELVYPLANSMHPINLGKIEFQWKRGSSDNTEFRIEAKADGDVYRFYVPCDDDECRYQMPGEDWMALGKAFAGEEFTVTIAGTSGKGAAVAVSDETKLHFTERGVFGALYYWAAQAGSIKRADLGSPTATEFIKPRSETNRGDCTGCHALSRDGTTIAFATAPMPVEEEIEGVPGKYVEGSVLSAIQIAPTADPANPMVEPALGTSPFGALTYAQPEWRLANPDTKGPEDHLGHNVALSSDGKRAAVNGVAVQADAWPPYFEIRDGTDGSSLGKWNLGDPIFNPGTTTDGIERLAMFPEWAPDNKSIVVSLAENVEGEECMYSTELCRGGIAILPVSDAGKISKPQMLVNPSTDEFYFYPTWSPDGKWVAFAAGKRTMSGGKYATSQGNKNAMLRLVKSSGGPYNCPSSDCIELENGRGYSSADAEAGNGKHSTWPKFTPFAQDDIMFISFNSHLDYGFEPPAMGDDGARLSQIWMFAIDVSKEGDPSYAPIWLPQQEPHDGALTPYWAERLPCEQDPTKGCKGCVGEEACQVSDDGQCSCVVVVK